MARKRRQNPALAIFGNPRGVVIARGVRRLEYDVNERRDLGGAARSKDRHGPWRHDFLARDTEIVGLPNGKVQLQSRSGTPLWDRETFLDNPGRSRRAPTMARKSKRRPPKGYRTWKAYMDAIRPNKSRKRSQRRENPMARRRKSSRRRRRKSNPGVRIVHVHQGARSSRRRRSRRHRRNPGGLRGITGFLMQAGKDSLGVLGGKVVSRGVPQLLGIQPTGLPGLLVQTAFGLGAALAVRQFVSPSIALSMATGALLNAEESLVRGAGVPVASAALSDAAELYSFAGYAQPAELPAGDGMGVYSPDQQIGEYDNGGEDRRMMVM